MAAPTMRLCGCCGTVNDGWADTCRACGEATWLETPEDRVSRMTIPDAPAAKAEEPKQKKGRR